MGEPENYTRWVKLVNKNRGCAKDMCESFLCAEDADDPRLCTSVATMKCPQCMAKFCSTECFRRSWKNHKVLHNIRDAIAAKGGPDTQHKIATILIPIGSYFGEIKIGVPLGTSVEQPAIDGCGQIANPWESYRLVGSFVGGVPVPYSKKHFPAGFDGPGGHHEVYSGHFNSRYKCSGDGMRVYANGDYFIGRWEEDARAEGRMVSKGGHAVFDGVVTNGFMTRGRIFYRKRFILGKKPQVVEPYGIAVQPVTEVETDVWQVTCSQGRIVGPTVITYHGGDVFECVYRDGDVDRNFPHKLTYADGSVDTVTIPLGVADRGNTRLEVEMINKETREVDGWIVSYVYR